MKEKGFTLIEILVVIAIFAFLGILVTRSIILTVGGSKKSESIVKVRQNLDYAVGVIERQLRNADTITECPNPDPNVISYKDQSGNPAFFSCVNIGSPTNVGFVASSSGTPGAPIIAGLLTSTDVNVVSCSFSCTQNSTTNPPVVSIMLDAKDATATGLQGADVTLSTSVSLRNY